MSWNRTKRAVAASTILVVFATCLLRDDDKLTKLNSVGSGATLRNVSVSVGSERPIRLDVPLVLVNVSAVDPEGRIVTGLRKEDFAIYEDGQPQRVSQFSKEDVPISIGLVFDTSGSMRDKIDISRTAVLEFLRTANQEDEFSLIEFNNRPSNVSDFTRNTTLLVTDLYSMQPGGRTSLLDAVYLGVSEMHQRSIPARLC